MNFDSFTPQELQAARDQTMTTNSPSQRCRDAGLDSLADLTRCIMEPGQKFLSVKRTLENWSVNKPKVFDACILYAVKNKVDNV